MILQYFYVYLYNKNILYDVVQFARSGPKSIIIIDIEGHSKSYIGLATVKWNFSFPVALGFDSEGLLSANSCQVSQSFKVCHNNS